MTQINEVNPNPSPEPEKQDFTIEELEEVLRRLKEDVQSLPFLCRRNPDELVADVCDEIMTKTKSSFHDKLELIEGDSRRDVEIPNRQTRKNLLRRRNFVRYRSAKRRLKSELNAAMSTLCNPIRDLRDIINDLFPMLTPVDRNIVTLKAMGYSSNEVGERTGMSPRSVLRHLNRIRSRYNA